MDTIYTVSYCVMQFWIVIFCVFHLDDRDMRKSIDTYSLLVSNNLVYFRNVVATHH